MKNETTTTATAIKPTSERDQPALFQSDLGRVQDQIDDIVELIDAANVLQRAGQVVTARSNVADRVLAKHPGDDWEQALRATVCRDDELEQWTHERLGKTLSALLDEQGHGPLTDYGVGIGEQAAESARNLAHERLVYLQAALNGFANVARAAWEASANAANVEDADTEAGGTSSESTTDEAGDAGEGSLTTYINTALAWCYAGDLPAKRFQNYAPFVGWLMAVPNDYCYITLQPNDARSVRGCESATLVNNIAWGGPDWTLNARQVQTLADLEDAGFIKVLHRENENEPRVYLTKEAVQAYAAFMVEWAGAPDCIVQ